jgi:hypothetical protein
MVVLLCATATVACIDYDVTVVGWDCVGCSVLSLDDIIGQCDAWG